MLSVSEFMKSLNRNQLCIKIVVQIDDYIELEYPSDCHIHFDDSIKLTNCRISPKNYLLIIEGEKETGQEVKLFWGEKHFELLKNTAPCTETITEFEKLKQLCLKQVCKLKQVCQYKQITHSFSNSLQKRRCNIVRRQVELNK